MKYGSIGSIIPSYYKAGEGKIDLDVFDGMINAICTSDIMKSMYKNKNCFDQKEIDKYVRDGLPDNRVQGRKAHQDKDPWKW